MRVLTLSALALLLAGRAEAIPEPQVATFAWSDHTVTVAVSACELVDAELQNTSDHPLGPVSTALVVLSPTGDTLLSDGISFPTTQAHVMAHASHIEFTSLGNCQGDHLEMRR